MKKKFEPYQEFLDEKEHGQRKAAGQQQDEEVRRRRGRTYFALVYPTHALKGSAAPRLYTTEARALSAASQISKDPRPIEHFKIVEVFVDMPF